MRPKDGASAHRYKAVVIGASAGGLNALPRLLSPLPRGFAAAVVVVQHIPPEGDLEFFRAALGKLSKLAVTEAVERAPLMPSVVHVAPPDYHLLIEPDGTFGISVDEKVNCSRPSIDVLFESAARAYGASVVGVVLTGASADGARGLAAIKDYGGFTLVQDPETAETRLMPRAAVERCAPHRVLTLEALAHELVRRVGRSTP